MKMIILTQNMRMMCRFGSSGFGKNMKKIRYEGKAYEHLRLHEKEILELISDYFSYEIICIDVGIGKIPDLRIRNIEWEIKSPISNGPKTIENILRKAKKQSENVILDLSRSKFIDSRALSRIRSYIKGNNRQIKRLIVVTKDKKILDLTKEL